MQKALLARRQVQHFKSAVDAFSEFYNKLYPEVKPAEELSQVSLGDSVQAKLKALWAKKA